ncbi:MAG: hypothetical protein CFE43_06005 [Burkholderiales bacterium PBB3]|nr:MAG: hypothetical protein CFE43_06005 [Burkholderiales bacterium PBB3]
MGEDFPALAFDIQISDAERTEFFTHVGQAVDGDSQHGYDLSLAFSHALPTPKSTLKKLLLLRGRQETCS